MERTIYDLELHEQLKIRDSFYILRVPGGWIYSFVSQLNGGFTDTFVPYSDEFDPNRYIDDDWDH